VSSPGATARDSVLVVRVWLESHQDPPFRARLLAGDLTNPKSVGTMTSPDHVVEAIRCWLSEYCEQLPS
jgi:hypothetical protein